MDCNWYYFSFWMEMCFRASRSKSLVTDSTHQNPWKCRLSHHKKGVEKGHGSSRLFHQYSSKIIQTIPNVNIVHTNTIDKNWECCCLRTKKWEKQGVNLYIKYHFEGSIIIFITFLYIINIFHLSVMFYFPINTCLLSIIFYIRN